MLESVATLLADIGDEVGHRLLLDHTTQRHIYWATDSYAHLGEGYAPLDPITADNADAIRPRWQKSREEQALRTKDKGEVFTPRHVCHQQIDMVDEAWGQQDWTVYVRAPRLEITCGEAPYLTDRRDVLTGALIPVPERRGILDRKLHMVSQNTESPGAWIRWGKAALMATYGYDWQGDNVLLARCALFRTFAEHYQHRFGAPVPERSMPGVAHIVACNVWQMDGRTGRLPLSDKPQRTVTQDDLFGAPEQWDCQRDGTYAIVHDWRARKDRRKIRFIDIHI